ncbi:DUF6544 family protein [Albidovulum sp.]
MLYYGAILPLAGAAVVLIVLSVLVLLAIAILAVQVRASRRFRARVLRLGAGLHRAPVARDQSARLPPVVADLARRAGADLSRPLRVASFNQTAELRTRRGGPFAPVRTWQMVALARPGFVWEARRDLGPLALLRVLDAFVDNEGRLEARLLGSVPVARAEGEKINLAEAYRYLAELPWAPDAIIGNPDLQWRVLSDSRVEVRLQTRDGTARVTFGLDAEGDIETVAAEARPVLMPDGTTRDLPWQGRFGDYARVGPRRIPTYGEVGNVYEDGLEIYFRGRITEYHVAG